jgi:hypothetical protein
MSEHGLHPERALPRDLLAPFFFTAPIALVVAGGVLLEAGAPALSTHWSSLTLSVVHLGTLGLITMFLVGLFHALLAVAGESEAPRLFSVHGLYYALLVGTAAFCWGTARSSASAVFFAVGAMGVMGVTLLVQAGTRLRRSRNRGPTVRGLRLALWGFFWVISLGIWLAHGHGGMQFPGQRSLWLQVHLTAGLCGWAGAMLMAVSWQVIPIVYGGEAAKGRVVTLLHTCVGLGVVLPCALLLADYFGWLPDGDWNRAPWAAALGLPALIAVWLAHPIVALSSGPGRSADAGLWIWRIGLGLGPFTLLAAVAAFTIDDPRLPLLFGWLSIFGWAGLSLHSLLLRVVPFLIQPMREGDAGSGRLWIEPRIPDPLVRITLALHLVTLVLGGIGIMGRGDLPIRIAGAAMVGLGIGLVVLHTRSIRRSNQLGGVGGQ